MPLVAQDNLAAAAVPQREDVRDVLVCRSARRIEELPQGAKVGTGSLRRQVQLLAARPDLTVVGIRGNVDTRVKKMRDGSCDAVILAMAGLRRSGLFDGADMTPIETNEMLPAAAQGALLVQCRANDRRMLDLLSAMDDKDTRLCVELERKIVAKLNGGLPFADRGTSTARWRAPDA